MAKKLKIAPLGDRVLLRPFTREELEGKTKSGIILPETIDREKPEQGEIIAVGEGKISDKGERIPIQVKVGDRVIFSKYGYDEIKVDGEEYYMLREDQIMAVLK